MFEAAARERVRSNEGELQNVGRAFLLICVRAGAIPALHNRSHSAFVIVSALYHRDCQCVCIISSR